MKTHIPFLRPGESAYLSDIEREVEPDEMIEFDDIKYENPEYKVETIDPHHYPAAKIEEVLNNGWHLYNWIVCRPFVMLFFSREKESE